MHTQHTRTHNTHTHTHAHIHTHAQTHRHTHTHTHTLVHACMHMCTHILAHTKSIIINQEINNLWLPEMTIKLHYWSCYVVTLVLQNKEKGTWQVIKV